MTLTNQPICMFCSRLHAPVPGKWGQFCDAFPGGKGIPESILTSKVDHRMQAVDGDHGLRFHAASPADAAQAAGVIAQAQGKKPPAPRSGDVTLTPEQEAALDAAWDTITDADIEASMKWYDETEEEQKESPTRHKSHQAKRESE